MARFAYGRVVSSFSSTFTGTENPLSESSNWSTPADRTDFRKLGGVAYGTQVGGAYDDSIAMLAGTWSPDCEIITTIFVGTTSGIQEVEHIHRCDATGRYYEVNFAHDGSYADFIRAEGGGIDLSDYTYIIPSLTYSIPGGGISNGNRLRTRMDGSLLQAWIDRGAGWVFIGEASDTAITSGKPGIGAFKTAGSGAMDQFCFTDFSVVEL
jgi:hypothetical protein